MSGRLLLISYDRKTATRGQTLVAVPVCEEALCRQEPTINVCKLKPRQISAGLCYNCFKTACSVDIFCKLLFRQPSSSVHNHNGGFLLTFICKKLPRYAFQWTLSRNLKLSEWCPLFQPTSTCLTIKKRGSAASGFLLTLLPITLQPPNYCRVRLR